jgi:hypothetical protein
MKLLLVLLLLVSTVLAHPSYPHKFFELLKDHDISCHYMLAQVQHAAKVTFSVEKTEETKLQIIEWGNDIVNQRTETMRLTFQKIPMQEEVACKIIERVYTQFQKEFDEAMPPFPIYLHYITPAI